MKQTGFQKAVGMMAATQSTLVTPFLFFIVMKLSSTFIPVLHSPTEPHTFSCPSHPANRNTTSKTITFHPITMVRHSTMPSEGPIFTNFSHRIL